MLWFPALPPAPSTASSFTCFSPWVLLPACICIIIASTMEYCAPTLQPFLAVAPFNYTVSMVGSVFATWSVVYSLFGVFVGKLDDRSAGRHAVSLMLFGMVLTGIGYILLAPAPWA